MSMIQNFDPIEAGISVIGVARKLFKAPFNILDQGIEKIRQLPIEEDRGYRSDLPPLINMVQSIFYAFYLYHRQIFDSSEVWARDVKKAAEFLTKPLFFPISFCRIGIALRDAVCESVVGNIAKAVAFAAFQIFHIIPYVLIGFGGKVVNLLYNATPVFLLTGIAASFLTIQIYLIYRLVREIEVSNRILEENLNLLNQLQHTANGAFQAGKRALRSLASYIPTWSPRKVS